MKIGNLEVYGIIYKIENLVNGKVYIGQTTQGFNKRYNRSGKDIERVYKTHKKCEKSNIRHNHHLLKSIEKYGFDNFKVDKIIDYAFSEYELDIKEKCWIQYYDSFYNGYNMTLGGDSAMRGSDHIMSRKVVQLSLDGEYIKTWDYMQQVSEELGIQKSDICSVCRHYGNDITAGGYMWVYEEEYDKNKEYKYIKPKHPMERNIVQLDFDGNFINEYNSITEVTNQNEGFIIGGIYKCCNGIRKSYKNYIWLFKEDYDPNKNYKYDAKSNGKSKPIVVFDKNMNILTECKSINEASIKFNYGVGQIKNHVHHRPNKITEHIFIFKDEYEKQIKNNESILR